ncbi:MAG: hypothetical protein R3B09_33520 [Nannocystaceae bacterium]
MTRVHVVDGRSRRSFDRRDVAAAAVAMGLLGGCPFAFDYSPGTITNPSEGPMAATDAWIHVYTPPGNLVRMRVDGSAVAPIVDAPLHVVDGDTRGELLVLSDPDTNLYVRRPGGSQVAIPELAGRFSAGCLSADGKTLAAVRHANFDVPQPGWRDDDAIYLIDVATLAVRIVAAESERMPTAIVCEAEAPVAWVHRMDGPDVRVDLESGARSEGIRPKEGIRAKFPPQAMTRCPASGATLDVRDAGDDGIDLVAADGTRRHLVQITGRKRGFHDYHPTVRDVGFVTGCAHVVFAFADAVWVTDVESGVTKRVISGTVVGNAPAP